MCGNFQLRIKKRQRYVDVEKCIGCGECVNVCPVSVPNEFEFGKVNRKAIYFTYPGMLPNAPSVDVENCLHEKGCRIHHVYSDIVLPPFQWRLYEEARKFAEFHKYQDVEVVPGDKVTVRYKKDDILEVDMAVLMCGIKPPDDFENIANIFNLNLNEFKFVEVNSRLNPSEALPGIFVAGGVSAPVNVEEAVQQAYASAGKVLSILRRDETLRLNAETCMIDESKCSKCGFCTTLCPYSAISYDEDGVKIDDAFCRGCGICASACPSGAIKARNYTQKQIFAEIEGLVK